MRLDDAFETMRNLPPQDLIPSLPIHDRVNG